MASERVFAPSGSQSNVSSLPRIEGWLISAIVHCLILLLLALLSIPGGGRFFQASVLIVRQNTEKVESLTTIDKDVLIPEVSSSNESLVTESDMLPAIVQSPLQFNYQDSVSQSSSQVERELLDSIVAGTSNDSHDAVFFGTSASGRDFVFILDCSGSMSARDNGRFERAREELVSSIAKLRPDQRFYVYLFNWSTFPMFGADDPRQLIEANGENVTKLRAWLYTIQPDSGTDPRRALLGSLALQPDAIFLLSDGKFNKPPASNALLGWDASAPTVFDIFAGSNGNSVQVNTIAFEDEVSAVGMEKLASLTNGQFRFVPAPGHNIGTVDTKVDPESLPQTPEARLELAKNVLLIRRAEKLLERKLFDHAAKLVKELDEQDLPSDVAARLRRIRQGG